DHGDFQDAGVAAQHVLDFLGVDVLPAADDHVFGSPDQSRLPGGIEVTDVAGVHPTVDDDARSFVGPAKVAAHDIRAGDDDLTVGTGGHLGAAFVDDPNLLAGEGNPDRKSVVW